MINSKNKLLSLKKSAMETTTQNPDIFSLAEFYIDFFEQQAQSACEWNLS